jgi:chaperonin GroES
VKARSQQSKPRPQQSKPRPQQSKLRPQQAKPGPQQAKARPLQDRVLVKRLAHAAEEIRGGIIIPDTAKEKPQQAEVVAVGPGKLRKDGSRQPMDVSAGDRVLVGKYSGSDIQIDDEDYVILREDEILAVLG